MVQEWKKITIFWVLLVCVVKACSGYVLDIVDLFHSIGLI